MDGDHRRALTKCQVTLLELLNPEDYVLDYLLSEEIISTAEKDKVSQKSTPKEQARELLTVIPRKGAKAWNAFLEGLLGSQADAHREAADALKKMLTRVTGVMEERSPRLPTSTTRTAGRESDESDGVLASLLACGGGGSRRSDQLTVDLNNFDEVYKMTSKPRGTAYIINNKKFLNGLAERIGTDVDRDGLKKLWTYLGFKTEIFEDQGRADLIKRLQDLAKQDHSGRDCVIVSILTHGVEGKLYGSDGNLVPVNDLTELFNNGEAHRSLIGKPKLFFLQACCGGKQDEGVDVTDGPGCWPPVLARIASTTDIFVGYASSPGYESLRNIKRGSWFVQGIIKTFRDYSDKEHLLDMMTRVSKCIATEFETISAKKQQPTQVSQLTKKLYFRPGYYHGK